MASIGSSTTGNWNVSTTWSPTVVPRGTDDVSIGVSGVTITVTDSEAAASIALTAGNLDLNGSSATLAVSGSLGVAGAFLINSSQGNDGGAAVTIGGTLANTGAIYIGPTNSSLVGSDTLTAAALVNSGAIYLYGNYGTGTLSQATLAVLVPAFGTMTGSYDLSGDSLVQFASGAVTAITGFVGENSVNARFAVAGASATNSALTSLASLSGQLYLDGGAVLATTTDLTLSGALHIDNRYGNDGGSTVTIGGTLTNTGAIYIGPSNGSLVGSDTLTVAALVNSGAIYLYGNYGTGTLNQPTLAALAPAPATVTGSYDLSGDSLVQFASGAVTSITGFVGENSSNARIAVAGSPATNSALTMLATLSGQLYLDGGAVLATNTNLAVLGSLYVDNRYGNDGGSMVTIGGTLNNTGAIYIGPSNNSLVGSDTLTAAALLNSGAIYLYGNYGTGTLSQATLAVLAPAPATLTGSYDLSGDSLVQFTSGAVTSITGFVGENSTNARIAVAGTPASNSALTTLASLSGQVYLDGGAVLATNTNLAVLGSLYVDNRYGNDGGSMVTIGGTLNNTGAIYIGPSNNSLVGSDTLTAAALLNSGAIYLYGNYGTGTLSHATLAVLAPAPATLTGSYDLSGDSLVQFASGAVTSITGFVGENSTNARIAVTGTTASNSALATLATLSGQFYLDGGAALATTTDLALSGALHIDNRYGNDGGSTVTIGGTLANTGAIYVGPSNSSLAGSDTLTAGALVNSGAIYLYGNFGTGTLNQATLAVLAPAPATLTGSYDLSGDSLVQFASGAVTSITGFVGENSRNARIAVPGTPATNSALTSLGTLAGTVFLDSGVTLTTTTDLAVSGSLHIDNRFGGDAGGSDVTIGGTLTNTGYVYVGNGNNQILASDTLTVAALVDTGNISVNGQYGAGTLIQATLAVLSAAPGTLAGTYDLEGDALLQFAAGGIATIAGHLVENGAKARIALGTAPASNGALASVSAITGEFDLDDHVTLATATDLTVSGRMLVDARFNGDAGGSVVTVAGTLANSGQIVLGIDNGSAQAADSITAAVLINSGTLSVHGSGAITATLTTTQSAGNVGHVTIDGGGTLAVTGAAGYAQSSGETYVGSVLNAPTVSLTGGSLDGSGTIAATVVNSGGTLFGGRAGGVGTLALSGNYTQSGGGEFDFDVQGTAAGAASLIAETSGSVTLNGGLLRISSGSFAFAVGQTFTLMTFAPNGLTGTFGSIAYNGTVTSNGNVIDLGNGVIGHVVYDNAGGRITLSAITSLGTLSPAQGTVTPTTISAGAVHTNSTGTIALTVANTATTGSAFLDASIGGITGQAIAAGTASLIGAGHSTATALVAGISTSSDGAKTGTVIVALASDAADGTSAQPLPSQTIAVSGTVYNEAVASASAPSVIVHPGDHGTVTLAIANAAPVDGYSEMLDARLAALSGGVVVGVSGTSVTLAAGASDSTTYAFSYTAPSASGVVTTQATFALASDGAGVDALGTTTLTSLVIPVSITVDSLAQAAFETLTGPGTITGGGQNFALNLGTIAQGTGNFVLGLGVANAATGAADLLSGSFTNAGNFVASGLAPFSTVAAGAADIAPRLTLDTSTSGVFTQTITLTPSGSNASGYAQVLPTETLTVTGTVAPLAAPTITAPAALMAFAGIATQLGTLSIVDPNNADPVTVTVSDSGGILTAVASGGATISGSGSNRLSMTGSIADINATLAAIAMRGSTGSDAITLTVVDSRNARSSVVIPIMVAALAPTAPVVNAPAHETVIPGVLSGLNNLSVSDPYADATGQTTTFSYTAPAGTTLTVTGPAGATITGQGTNAITIVGTPAQINADLSDGLTIGQGIGIALGLLALLATIGYFSSNNGSTTPPADFQGTSQVQAVEGTYESAVKTYDYRTGGATGVGNGNAHIVTADGAIYEFDGAGEFTLAASKLAGNSFNVQVRLQPYLGSAGAAAITSTALRIGSDRVTIAIGRSVVMMVNGAAVTLAVNAPLILGGGQIVRLADNVYQLTLNTGEVVTVVDKLTYLNVGVSLAAGDPAGSVIGLVGPGLGQASDFQLPDGTILQQPLTDTQLYQVFANAWRITQAASLFDYAAGQSTATFTDTSFPAHLITLSDFPAQVVAQAAAAVAAAGITDPNVAAATEIDYIATGNDPAAIADDQGFFGTASHAAPTIVRTGTPPTVLLLGATAPNVVPSTTQATPVVFSVTSTNPPSHDITVAYAVVAAGASYLNAVDFGGVLPSGTITILAGQSVGDVTIAVPPGALGSAAAKLLQVQITSSDGTAIFASTATTTLGKAAGGTPPVLGLSYLTAFGDFSRVDNVTYNLDLGPVVLGQPIPTLAFRIANGAKIPADGLGGSLAAPAIEGFTVSGLGALTSIAPGSAYQGLTVSVVQNKFGFNTETVTFNPTDTNIGGFSAPLPPITINISYTLEASTTAYSEAWGDVHIITYNGLRYDLQSVGEFILAHSTAPGDSFDIQLRLQQWYSGAMVSIITQVAMSLGTDRVTLDLNRANFLAVNGTAVTLTVGSAMTLNGGTVTELSSTSYKLKWNTGETATVTNAGGYLNVTDSFPASETGTISGIQGENEGQSNDFQLPNGTVLTQPLSRDTLYGEFADAWRVSDATALFDYAPGQDTATFTDRSFPSDVIQLANLPASVVANAAAMVAAAGITDPGIAQAAELDYIATNDPTFITSAAVVQQTGFATTPATVTIPPTLPLAGVNAVSANVTEAASGTTSVTFNVFLTAAADTPTTVAYTTIAPDGSYLGEAAFGGTLPSGSVTIPAGQTTAPVTITVPQGALGTSATETLAVRISAPTGLGIFAPTAQSEIVNNLPEAGTAAAFALLSLSAVGTFTHVGNAYTLDLGSVAKDTLLTALQFAIANTAAAPADNLRGIFNPPIGTGFTVTGDNIGQSIAPGQDYSGLYFAPRLNTIGTNSMTLTFTPADVNDSGYVQALTAVTLTVTDSVTAPAGASLNTPGTVIFPNVRAGTSENRIVSVTNTAAAPAAGLAVTPTASGNATASGSIAGLAPGVTDATSISVGLNTATPGAAGGAVTLSAGSSTGGDGGNAAAAPLPTSPVVDVFGAVYRTATATIAPVSRIVHVGDVGRVALAVTNTASADGYSENLVAVVGGVAGGLAGTGATTADVAPGQTDATSLAIGYATASATTISGTATVNLVSDGGIGAGAVDGLGTLAVGTQSVPVNVTVENYAAPTFEKLGGVGTLTINGNAATLDLGTIGQGSGVVTSAIGILNGATGPADLLSGSLTAGTASGALSETGLVAFSGLAAGQADTTPTISLDTSIAGSVSQTIVLVPTGSNASGFSAALATRTLTVRGVVSPAAITPPPIIIGGLLPFAALGVSASDPNATPSVTATLAPAVPGIYSNLGGGSLDASGAVYTTTQTASLDTVALNGATFGTTQNGFPLLGISATLNGGAGFGATLFDEGSGTDTIVAGDGNDTLFVLPSNAVLYGGPGNDLLFPSGANDTLHGGAGTSTMVGGATNTTFLLGDAPQLVFDGGGAALIVGGAGADTIVGLSGNDTINLGSGGNLVGLAQGNNLIVSTGVDTLIGGAGADTVVASGNALAFGGAGQLTFFNGTGQSTVIGGSGVGSVTVNGGSGGGLFGGGRGGNNLIIAGQQTTTIYGAADGDRLYATGAANDVLVAGSGNETLSGVDSSAADIYFAGTGSDCIVAGPGNSVVVAASGNETVNLGQGNDVLAFINGLGGGMSLINNFQVGADKISLQRFAPNVRGSVVASATVLNNAVTFTLPDNTRVTLANVTDLSNVFA